MLRGMKAAICAVIAIAISLGLLLAAPLHAQAPQAAPPVLTPTQIVEAAPAADWVTIAPEDLLVMTLAPDAAGHPRQVVIQLIPAPFSQGWVGNIRKLAAAHWWDGLSINRVQDNFVAQWGDADGDDKVRARKLPAGLASIAQNSGDFSDNPYVKQTKFLVQSHASAVRNRETNMWAEPDMVLNHQVDSYAPATGFYRGWPMAGKTNGSANYADVSWPIHCYATVGVGRDMPPDTGSGAELYAVIGTPPRQLDRNLAIIGRVISGIEHLSSLPRGTGDLGFYTAAAERTPILTIRLASELPPAQQPHFQYLSTESASFVRYAGARANRRDAFYIHPAGGADICNIPVPIRRAP